jgi:hypothetical protein
MPRDRDQQRAGDRIDRPCFERNDGCSRLCQGPP